ASAMEASPPDLRGRRVALLAVKTHRASRASRRVGRSEPRKSAAGDAERIRRSAVSQSVRGRRQAVVRAPGLVHTRIRDLLRQFRLIGQSREERAMARITGLAPRRNNARRREPFVISAGIVVLAAVVLVCAGLVSIPLWTALVQN